MTQTQIFSLSTLPTIVANQEVAQHNNLIFAPFALASTESKIFITMLSYIDRKKLSDENFPEWQIPITDIIPHRNGYYFEEFKKAARNLVSYVVDIAPTEDKKRKTMPRTIVRKCDHEEGKGYAVCQFHEDMKEYLLKLIGSYTRADLAVLKNFKDEKSVRFYWMLKSRFYKGNEVIITVEECRNCLLEKGATTYPYPNDLKKHILDKTIQQELSFTDCAFEIGKIIKNGKSTVGWTFIRKEGSYTLLEPSPIQLSDTLLSLLASCRVDKKGLAKINEMMGTTINGVLVNEKFVSYVATERRKEKQAKGDKIGNLGGYIIDTIKEGWLCRQFLSQDSPACPKTVYKQPVSIKRAAADMADPIEISLEQAEAMYKKEKGQGTTKFPFAGFVKGMKSGRNIIVKGFKY